MPARGRARQLGAPPRTGPLRGLCVPQLAGARGVRRAAHARAPRGERRVRAVDRVRRTHYTITTHYKYHTGIVTCDTVTLRNIEIE